MIQKPLIAEDIPARGLGIGERSSVSSTHDADHLVEEVEADGTVLRFDGGALKLAGGVGDRDAVGPEETVGCAGAEGGDGLAEGDAAG